MLYLLHFTVIAASMDIDGNRVPRGSEFSIRSDDPRASAWEASPRMKLTGRELIGTTNPAASAASHAHRLIDALALAVREFSRAVEALPDAEAGALATVWTARSAGAIGRPIGDAIQSLIQRGFLAADKYDDGDDFDALPPSGLDDYPDADSEPEAPAAPVDDAPSVAAEIPAPAPGGDGWDAIDDDFAAVASGPDRAALAALVGDDDATLKAMHGAIEGSAIEVATTKRAQREAIAAWLAANPG